MATFHAGNAGTVSLGGATTLSVTKWEMTTRNVLADITNSGSSGNRQWQATIDEGEFSADFVFDSDYLLEPDASASPGASVSVILTAGASGKNYTFTAVIEEIRITNINTGDVVRGSLKGKSSGAITAPAT